MGSSKSAAPPPPDPAIGQAALMQGQLGKEYLDFQKQQFAKSEARLDSEQGMYQKVIDSQMATQDRANAWSEQDRAAGTAAKSDFDVMAYQAQKLGAGYQTQADQMAAKFGGMADAQSAFGSAQRGRYRQTFAPIEDRLASDAMTWDSAERQESEAAAARADVTTGAARQQEAQRRQMAAMGVNPMSGRFQGIDRGIALDTALAGAGAENVARNGIRREAIDMRNNAVGVGQNVLSSGQQASAMGMQAAQAQMGAQQAAYGIGSSALGQAGQFKGAGLSAMAGGLSAAQLGLSAGGAAVGTQGAVNNGYLASNGIMASGYNGAQQGMAGQAGTLASQYGAQLQAHGQAQAAGASRAAGIGSLLGTAATTGTMLFL